jgi:tetratricopeptide (TPR) repeat protein
MVLQGCRFKVDSRPACLAWLVDRESVLMQRPSLQIIWLATTLVFSGYCSAASGVAPPSQAEALALLTSNQFAELDRRYTEIQNAYRTGSLTDEDLRAAFRVFYATDATLESKYTLWVRQMPHSYVAHLARGIYYKKLGQERRGDKFISDTSEAQLNGMRDAFALASQDLFASLSLDDQPLLSVMHAIDLSNFLGQPDESRRLLDLAIKIDPHNFIVREKYMGTLQTRWGGSVGQMKLFWNECRKAHLSAAHLQSLKALVDEDEGWSKRYREGDAGGAVHAYLKAAKLKPEGSCKPCGPIGEAADALFDSGRFKEAIPLYSKVLNAAPDSISTLDHRGFSELQVAQPTGAVADFTHAADLGDAYAMDMLGKMYLLGTSIPQDRDKAIQWLKRAAALGYGPSKELLPSALDPNRTPLPEPGGPRM